MTALKKLWSIKNHDSEDDQAGNCVYSVTVFPQINGDLGKLEGESGVDVKTHVLVLFVLLLVFVFRFVDLNIVSKESEEQHSSISVIPFTFKTRKLYAFFLFCESMHRHQKTQSSIFVPAILALNPPWIPCPSKNEEITCGILDAPDPPSSRRK